MSRIQVLKGLVYENEHHFAIYSNALVEWMTRPALASSITEMPFALSVIISLLLFVFYGYKTDPFGNYAGSYEV